mmetsp:Transcript_115197/g.246178  ORF Transcript_115197/g.246178 Transcript_115197/m.246178 type:complete len:389 (-) Transcript_115197:29-1195(-)
MPMYEEKFLCPLAVRFSQFRIRPTFQDGRLVERSLQQIEALPWPLDDSYDVFLSAPFPPIEIIRWRPKLRTEDGSTRVDEDGMILFGESCWFTFDNRRLYCLQVAAAKVWPRRVAAIVHVMHDLPTNKCTPRKFRTTDLGNSIRISRRNDPEPREVWTWAEAVGKSSSSGGSQASRVALEAIEKDAAKEDWDELTEVPADFQQRSCSSTPVGGAQIQLETLLSPTLSATSGSAPGDEEGSPKALNLPSPSAAMGAPSRPPNSRLGKDMAPRSFPLPPGACTSANQKGNTAAVAASLYAATAVNEVGYSSAYGSASRDAYAGQGNLGLTAPSASKGIPLSLQRGLAKVSPCGAAMATPTPASMSLLLPTTAGSQTGDLDEDDDDNCVQS